MSLHEVRVTDGAKKEISAQRWVFIGNKSWLPDGSGLIVTAREWKANVTQLWFVSYPSGEAHQISEDFDDFTRARLTSDGRVMVAGQMSSVSHIWSGPLTDTSHVTKIGVWGRAGVSFLSGRHIVYSSLQSGEVPQIWMMNVDGTGPKQLTTDGANDISPVASPDGRYVIFCSNRSGNHEIWRVNADGAHVVQLTHTTGATFPTVSPDGRWVIYRATADSALYKIPIEGGEPQRVAGNAVGVSAVSPDGKMIAYFTQGKETWDITVSFLQTGLLTKTLTIGSHSLNNGSLKWTPDGKALLYSSNTNGIGNIWQQPLDGSPSIQVTDFKEDGIFSFDVSRDGKELICARGGWKHDVVLVKNLRS
jgi:TolB protein